MSIRLTFVFFAFVILSFPAYAMDWPLWHDSLAHPIGNSYGVYQAYEDLGSSPYLHTGIDIMVPHGTHVYAVKAGYVKAIMTTGAETHWRIAIGDSAGSQECEAWMYAHVDSVSIFDSAGISLGAWIEEGQYIGNVVDWTIEDFDDHLHFSKIKYSGSDWGTNFSYWNYFANPLDELTGLFDPDAPVFLNARETQLLAFCRNNTDDYFDAGTILTGDVDIVCRVYDNINHEYVQVPYKLEYKIEGDTSTPWFTSFCFTGPIGPYSEHLYKANTIYQNDSVCDSRGDYTDRWYFINMTNNDGDSLIETGDINQSWKTGQFPNGEYKILIRASDRAGNQTIDSTSVSIDNRYYLSGRLSLDKPGDDLEGTIVTIINMEISDTTDATGNYRIDSLPAGRHQITTYRQGYAGLDTSVALFQNTTLSRELKSYVCGDANGNTALNILDVTYLINYIYKDGPPPIPPEAGDANGNHATNILDVTYLIYYLYRDGPSPICP